MSCGCPCEKGALPLTLLRQDYPAALEGGGQWKIRIIDFGLPENHRPLRSHANDAGADVYMPFDCTLEPGGIAKIPLGFGLEVPDGYAAYVFPRSSLAAKGVVCELPPVDSGYRGEIHAIVSNVGNETQTLAKDSGSGSLSSCLW